MEGDPPALEDTRLEGGLEGGRHIEGGERHHTEGEEGQEGVLGQIQKQQGAGRGADHHKPEKGLHTAAVRFLEGRGQTGASNGKLTFTTFGALDGHTGSMRYLPARENTKL